MVSAFVNALFWGSSEDLGKFRNLIVCGMCGDDSLQCRCHDMPYEISIDQKNQEYCSGCLFDKMYCECREGEFDFTSDMDDFNPFPEADEFPRLFVEQHWHWFPRRHELSKGDISWKRQVRVVKQWARHAHRIAKNVKPLDLFDYLVIRDFVYPD